MTDDEVLRLFFALEITDEVREALAARQEELKQTGVRVGWVAPGKIHLTLAFLGDLFAAGVEGLQHVLDQAGREVAPFRFMVAGLGAFGPERSPRVIWAGIADPPEELMALQRELAAGAQRLGVRLESRPFHPHLTLGRVRSSRGAGALTSLIESAKDRPFGWVDVNRVLLLRSRLASHGARYEILYSAPLKGAGTHGR